MQTDMQMQVDTAFARLMCTVHHYHYSSSVRYEYGNGTATVQGTRMFPSLQVVFSSFFSEICLSHPSASQSAASASLLAMLASTGLLGAATGAGYGDLNGEMAPTGYSRG